MIEDNHELFTFLTYSKLSHVADKIVDMRASKDPTMSDKSKRSQYTYIYREIRSIVDQCHMLKGEGLRNYTNAYELRHFKCSEIDDFFKLGVIYD